MTQVGDDWQVVRARMNRLGYSLRSALGPEHQWCWATEPNPRGTGHHVHAYQRGPFVPQALLSEVAGRCGMGEVVDIRRLSAPAGHYALKGAGYAVKGAGSESFLELNGHRITHASREFWRAGQGGGRLSVRQAEREALRGFVGGCTNTEVGHLHGVERLRPHAGYLDLARAVTEDGQ
jgi:hypothetical protein